MINYIIALVIGSLVIGAMLLGKYYEHKEKKNNDIKEEENFLLDIFEADHDLF